MTAPYRIYGLELSPYSVKVRSYFRYLDQPHEWIVRSMDKMEEFQQYAKLPLIPLVVTPDGLAMQDSTPIIETVEAAQSKAILSTGDAALDFISALLEEYSDEWGSKPMFHYRWAYQENQDSCAQRIAQSMLGSEELSDPAIEFADAIKSRMISRLSLVGSREENKGLIEGSFLRLLNLLEVHLATRLYIFGGKPTMADLGLFSQLYESSTDPYCQPIMKPFTNIAQWIKRMLSPTAMGDFEPIDALAATLEPILMQEVAGLFFPWTCANAAAIEKGDGEFEVELKGQNFKQATQKYHAKSLLKIKNKYAAVADNEPLNALLNRTQCLAFLQ